MSSTLTNERRGEIALAALTLMLLEKGIALNPQIIRTKIGKAVEGLNKKFPTLRVTKDEVTTMLEEITRVAFNETFKQRKPAAEVVVERFRKSLQPPRK